MALPLRLSRLHDFARQHVPGPPARLLEAGCGDGELARRFAAEGYEVVGVDPQAPEGEMFRRLPLEELDEAGAFDAVIASLVLHHVGDLEPAVSKLASFLRPGGRLVVQELAKERHTGATARWHYERRQAALAAEAGSGYAESYEAWLERTEANLADMHAFGDVERALERRFRSDVVEDVPYLYGWDLDEAVEPEERAAIRAGSIAATGVLYAGTLRALVS